MFQEGFFEKVYYRFWRTSNETPAIANIFAIHGLGGHSFWFNDAAVKLSKYKINLFAFDLPGFGKSDYTKGEADSYNVWLDTSKEILEKFLLAFEIKAPVFVLGHSMGALIAILLSKKVKANGWILSVPGFEGNRDIFPLNGFILPVLCKAVINPKEKIITPFGPELLTRNKETQLKLKKDPLRVINVSAELFKHVYFLAKAAKSSATTFEQSLFMLMAGEDKVCSNSAMEDFFKAALTKDKKLKIYNGVFHDLFIEDELNQLTEDLYQWIKLHIK